MQHFRYDGPVMHFDKCVESTWRAITKAPTAARAKSNLAYRYKVENDLAPNAKISLPGKIIAV